MTKSPLPLTVEDLTPFTRALAKELGTSAPAHLSLMNMLARAAGFQNVQHMRAAHAAHKRLERPQAAIQPDSRTVERCLHQFDEAGRLIQWPAKRAIQTLALWALWARLPADTQMDEKTINTHLNAAHLFNDPATLRRTMISCTLLTRKRDGSGYRRIERVPPVEAKALITALRTRVTAAS
ncbi:DUF2087 domain-containing protein [Thalassobius sp. Cn5-15]|uniref:DUF2087 domain-containing protein n=1 Tax=Thalassobius sp. Cn5-15 TaxID=2917763 RepID=UPI001EF36FB3|nr:DUF2087 domain-containing protein [Thalassobius sp. Cn5-15]MCG7494948.1 DUF2087 domain-containing protein [Thalassobius sp. Cn5-15]